MIAAILALVSGMIEFGFAIFVVVIVNAIMSFVQEHRAEKAVKALKKFLPFRATVIRDNESKLVQAEDIVPGDLLILEEGARSSRRTSHRSLRSIDRQRCTDRRI